MGKGPVTQTMDALHLRKRSKPLGVPIGRKRPDWVRIGLLGAGVASSVAGGLRARRATNGVVERVREGVREPVRKAKQVADESVGGGGSSGPYVKKLRLIIDESVDVAVPRRTAYNQWTQFEELPEIMKSVVSIDQRDDDVTGWTAKIGPSRRRWTAEILEQDPDERIVWRATEGAEHRGTVTFHELDGTLTRVQVEMEYFPTGLIERIGNIFLVARRCVRKDLRLFKHYMELAGEETGAWRGEISKDEGGHKVDGPGHPQGQGHGGGEEDADGRERAESHGQHQESVGRQG